MLDGPMMTGLAAMLTAGVALANGIRQDKRAQFSQMVTILSQLDARFESNEFRAVRRTCANWLRMGSLETDTVGEQAAKDLLNFFETLAFLHRREAVERDAVWHYFASTFMPYFVALKTLRKRYQESDPNVFRESADLYEAIFQAERENRDYVGTEEVVSDTAIAEFLKAECDLPEATTART
jgi:hypothetical protein